MMNSISLRHSNANVVGEIKLDGSKSISNRVLLIRALCKENFRIDNLSESDDTKTMVSLLEQNGIEYNAHHAGTTFRFLTAYLSLQEGQQILTGSDRMKQRPIMPLVDALRSIGARIDYIEKEGYPPLLIGAPIQPLKSYIKINSSISSQYISALLMIAPVLPNGLTIEMAGEQVSTSYIKMTLDIMKCFGIHHTWVGSTIAVKQQAYKPISFQVESDWSAASYYYSIASIANSASITLKGLYASSMQGDTCIAKIAEKFGVLTEYIADGVKLSKFETSNNNFIEHNFIEHPDIAQTVFVMCAAKGYHGLFSGLKTLKIKETDRIDACSKELAKVNCFLTKIPEKFKKKKTEEMFMLDGQAIVNTIPIFDTYQDHRMAMAFAPLSLLGEIVINQPEVVSKSCSNFWNDLEKLGFEIKKIEVDAKR